MINFDWSSVAQSVEAFGGTERTLRIPKTGLPFYDALRLYGAIEFYIGLRDEVTINDRGQEWIVTAKVRDSEAAHQPRRVSQAAHRLNKGKSLTKDDLLLVEQLPFCLQEGRWITSRTRDVSSPLHNPDSALKDGIRSTAAATYKGLETGSGKDSKVYWSDALLAYSGQKRTEVTAGLVFLPVFEGTVDFSKVVSPLHTWTAVPNILCVQVLTLLALKTSLFAEGYADRLSSVVYNMDKDESKGFFNYSGQISISSTALNRQQFAGSRFGTFARFVGHFYHTFRGIVGRAWNKGEATGEVGDALAHAYWLMQPSRPKHLTSLLTSVERQRRDNKPTVLVLTGSSSESYVQEVFHMSYGNWHGDHEALRRFAKAVASGIYYARQVDVEQTERGKKWYDEATMLRSAPSPKAFVERAMILIEQGKRANNALGTSAWNQDFEPAQIFQSIGNTRSEFETFRDLFRMYLVQESKPFTAEESTPDTDVTKDVAVVPDEEGDDE